MPNVTYTYPFPTLLKNVLDPVDSTDVATKGYVDSRSAEPSGSNTQVQFNNDGAFGASSNLTFDSNTNTLSTTAFNAGQANGTQLTVDSVAVSISQGNTLFTLNNNLNVATDGVVALTGSQIVLTGNGIALDGSATGITVLSSIDLGAVDSVKITGGTSGQYLRTDGLGNLSFANIETDSVLYGEYHVSVSGSDTFGDGTQGRPYANIQTAVDLATAAGVPAKVIVHVGSYATPVSITGNNISIVAAQGDSGVAVDIGNVTVTEPSTGVRLQGLRTGDLVIDTTKNFYVDQVNVQGSFIANRSGYTEVRDSVIQLIDRTSGGGIVQIGANGSSADPFVKFINTATRAVRVYGNGFAYFDNCGESDYGMVLNENAIVLAYNSRFSRNNAGNVSGAGGAITTSAGTTLVLNNTIVNNTSGDLPTYMTIAGNYSLNGVTFDYANSNITGTNLDVSNITFNRVRAARLNVSDSAYLGAVGNITITGGANGQVLTTNGNGVLSWANTTRPAGANSQVQFNSNGQFAATANFTFNTATNTLLATRFAGDGYSLSNINVSNVTGLGDVALINTSGDGTQVLAGNGAWVTPSYAQPGGNVSTVQFNAGGTFAGVEGVTSNGIGLSMQVGNVSIGGGLPGQVLTTDGNGVLSWATVQSGGGGAIIFSSATWTAGNSVAEDAYYWDGSVSAVNQKPVQITYTAIGNNNQLDSMTINGVSITTAGTTVTPTSVTVPATNIPANVQTATGQLQMIMTISNSGNAPQLGSTVLTPQLVNVDPFAVTGSPTIASAPDAAVPFWQSANSTGSITASGLTVSGGTLSNAVYTLTRDGNVVATSPSQSTLSQYTFTAQPAGHDYRISIDINGSGTHGANPTVAWPTQITGTVPLAANTYTPLFTTVTASNAIPTFDTGNAQQHSNTQFASGQTVTSPVIGSTDYWWLATPSPGPRTFVTQVGTFEILITPTTVGNTTINTQVYNVYGFEGIGSNLVVTIR